MEAVFQTREKILRKVKQEEREAKEAKGRAEEKEREGGEGKSKGQGKGKGRGKGSWRGLKSAIASNKSTQQDEARQPVPSGSNVRLEDLPRQTTDDADEEQGYAKPVWRFLGLRRRQRETGDV